MTFEYWYDGADNRFHWHLRIGERIIARSPDEGIGELENCLATIQQVQRSMTAGTPVQLPHKNLRS